MTIKKEYLHRTKVFNKKKNLLDSRKYLRKLKLHHSN